MTVNGLTTEGAVLQVNTGTVPSPIWTPVIERSQLRDPKSGDAIDMTTFDDAGFRAFKPGLRTIGVEATGNYVPTDTGYAVLETAWIDGATIGVRFGWKTSEPGELPVTHDGFRIDECVITDLGTGGNVGEKVELSLRLQGSGAPTPVTF